jgi:imidazolonepropionase-like amidohydrolase
MLFNLGNSPKEAYQSKGAGTRMGTAAIIRQGLSEAANYRRKQEKSSEKEPTARDLKLEALSQVLDGKLPALFCAQQANDLITALRLINEFKLKGELALAADGYLVASQIADAQVPVIVHPTMQRIGGLETYNTILGNAAALSNAGIRVAIGSAFEDYVPKTRVVRQEAAMAAVYGLGVDAALRSITLDAARILGIEDRFGSIDVGKIADLVLYDGDPFEHATHTTHVLVDGRVVYDRAQREPIPLTQRAWMSSPELPCCLQF